VEENVVVRNQRGSVEYVQEMFSTAMAAIMVYKRRECRIMLVFLWLLQILLKLTVFILSLCVGLLTNNILLLLFTSQLNVQYRTLIFRYKQKGSVYIIAISSD